MRSAKDRGGPLPSGIGTAVVLGSGLSAQAMPGSAREVASYSDIPGFDSLGVAGHPGKIYLWGAGDGVIALLAGRYHFYEGGGAERAGSTAALARLMGCRRLVLTHAAGSLRRGLTPGSWLLARDIVSFPARGMRARGAAGGGNEPSAARGMQARGATGGGNEPSAARGMRARSATGGGNEPSAARGMTAGDAASAASGAGLIKGAVSGDRGQIKAGGYPLISRRLTDSIASAGRECGVRLEEGTLFWATGPAYETPAEAIAAVEVGADAATMSSLPELAEAARLGMEAASLAWVTNYTPNVSGTGTEHGEVLSMGSAGSGELFALLGALRRMLK